MRILYRSACAFKRIVDGLLHCHRPAFGPGRRKRFIARRARLSSSIIDAVGESGAASWSFIPLHSNVAGYAPVTTCGIVTGAFAA